MPAGVSDFTGRIIVDGTNASHNGQLQFQGAGRFTNVGEVVARAGGIVRFLTAAPVLPAHAPITLEGGVLDYQTGPATLAVGPLTARGFGTVNVATGPTESVQVDFDSISTAPENSGQFYVTFSNANAGGAPGPGIANVRLGAGFAARLVGAGLGATDRPIVPFAVGSYTVGGNMVMPGALAYSPNGLRLLTDAEYASTVVAGANVRFADQIAQETNIAINSLTFSDAVAPSGSTGLLSGAGTVRVASGLILAAKQASISTALEFADRRATIFALHSGGLSLMGKISGSNGLAIGASPYAGPVFLGSTANDFTGPIFVNSATLSFSDPAVFGATANSIILNGGTLQLSSSSTTTLNRAIDLGAGGGVLRTGSFSQMTMGGPISGPGTLQISGSVTLAAANTYTGNTLISNTTVTLASPQGFGLSPSIDINGTLRLATSWTTAAEIRASSSSNAVIDTNGFDATLTGPVANQSTLRKQGPGRLSVLNATGSFNVDGGTFVVAGPIGGSVNTVVGTTLTGSGSVGGEGTIRGRIEPGDGVARLSFNALSLYSTATLSLQLGSVASYDQCTVVGQFYLGNAAKLELNLLPGFMAQAGVDRFRIVDFTGAGNIITDTGGSLFSYNGNLIPESGRFAVSGWLFEMTYHGGTGNDVELLVLPEPGSLAFWLTGLLALTVRRRRS